VDTTLSYTCAFPLVGSDSVTLKWQPQIPEVMPINTEVPFGPFPVTIGMSAKAGKAMGLLGAKSVSGSLTSGYALDLGYPDSGPLEFDGPVTFPATPVSQVGAFEIPAVADMPSITSDVGHGSLAVGDFTLHATFFRADGTPVLWPGANEDKSIDVSCTLDAGQSPTIATFDFVAPVLGTATASVSKSEVRVGESVRASVDVDLADGSSARGQKVAVLVDGAEVDTVRLGRGGRASYRLSGLEPGTHTVQFVGIGDIGGLESNAVTVTVVKRRHR